MEQSELIKIIAVLKVAYPYYFKDLSQEDVLVIISIYKQQFKEFCYQVMSMAINILIKKSKYMPSIAEIYEECRTQEIEFFKLVLLKNKDVEHSRRKSLNDMLDWYSIQEEIPKEIKNEVLGYYKQIATTPKEIEG